MLLWELVLTADVRLDLSAAGHVLVWLAEVNLVVPLVETGRGKNRRREPQPGCWTEAHATFFVDRLLALRSIGARLKGFESRAPRADGWEADQVLRMYLGYVRVSVDRKPPRRSSASTRPLDRDNFAGLKFGTELPAEVEAGFAKVGSAGAKALQGDTHRELDLFFANAFASLVITDLAPVCGRCGSKLEPTPSGRRPRAKFCKSCAFRVWQEGQSQDEKRRRWREDKEQQRGGNK